jgi:chaperonin GroEL (HSP60 family)
LTPSFLSQAKHANGEHPWGVNGETGKIVDMKEYGLYESASVKIQTFKTAIEVRWLFRFVAPSYWLKLIN